MLTKKRPTKKRSSKPKAKAAAKPKAKASKKTDPKKPKPIRPKAVKGKPDRVEVDLVEWEHTIEVQKLAAEIEVDQGRYNEMKKAGKELHGAISGKQVTLRKLITEGPERYPLFDKPTATPPKVVTGKGAKNGRQVVSEGAAAPFGSTGAQATDPDAWRAAPLQASLHKPGERALTTGINALLKAGVTTIGQLVDKQSKGFGWTDAIPGFGEAAVTALENALTDYLTRTRDKGVFADAAAQALKRADEKAKETEPAKAEKFPDDGNGKSIAETQAATKKAEGAKAKKSNRPRKAK